MIFTAPGIKGTLEQFIIGIERTIGGDQNKAKGLVFGAAALLREFSEQSLMIDDKITPWSVGTVLLTALRFVTDEPIMPDSDSKCIGFRDEAYQLAEQAEGLVPQVLLQDSPPRSAHLQNFVWYMYAGQVIQGDIGHRIATALILTGLCGFNNLAKNPNPTHELFSNLGVDAFEYFTLMYCVSVMTSESMFANADQFLEKSPRADRLKPCLMAVFEEAGISWQRKMRNEQLRFAQDFEGKAHAMAILTRYPLVMMSPNRVMLLGVPFLRSHGAEKFVTKCQQLARKKYGRPSNIYTSEFLGIRFEKFFFELCDIWRPGQHFGDFKYYIGKNECKAPDRIVFESKKSREHAVFFQQKCRFLGEESVAGTECKTIREEIKK